ncbi:MAG: quinol dehydrogenase ferredoxin subunit NapH [Alphaproteobacteria bacterium]|nr:quinol dehydrogenase ferredoxin subunit NapH [Alphaproteobacteria bacterium]
MRAAGWKWLIARRLSQALFVALFLAGPLAGLWVVEGTLASSLTLGVLPLTDPLILLQSLLARHWPEATALLGAAIVVAGYLLVGGRAYCSWVCPLNPVTDAAHWLREKLGLRESVTISPRLRLWVLAGALAASALFGTLAWELVNPVTITHRALVFGGGVMWMVAVGVFVFDLAIARRGWCGHLCPVGAAYGLIGKGSLLRVSAVRREACDDCMDCYAVCPEPRVLAPALRGKAKGFGPVILSGDCTNCGRCIDVCPQDVFGFASRFDKREQTIGQQQGEYVP